MKETNPSAYPKKVKDRTPDNDVIELHMLDKTGSTNGESSYSRGLVQIDEDDGMQLYDCGFLIIPGARRTSQALYGLVWARTKEYRLGNPIAAVWIHVDFDDHGVFDDNQQLTAINSRRLTDTFENNHDMTGAINFSVAQGHPANGQPPLASPVSINVAWGHDPTRSMSDDNEAVLPLANPDSIESKFVNQIGDIIRYIIIVSNVGFSDLTGGSIDDPFSAGRLVGPSEPRYVDYVLIRGENFTYREDYTVTMGDITTRDGDDNNIASRASVPIKE